MAVVIQCDFKSLIVGNPHPHLPATLQVVEETTLKTVAHSKLGAEAMTFTQSVPVAFLARQVPQHRVRVRPCQSRGDASPGQFRSPALVQTVIRKSCVVVLKVVAGAVHMTCLALPACLALRACLGWTCPTVCCTANRRLAITHGVVCGQSRRGCKQVLMTNLKNCIFASHVTSGRRYGVAA